MDDIGIDQFVFTAEINLFNRKELIENENIWNTNQNTFTDLTRKLGQNKSGVAFFSFGNTRINYEENTVSSAVFLTNYATPKPKLLEKKFNRFTNRTEIVVHEKEKVEQIVQRNAEIKEHKRTITDTKGQCHHTEWTLVWTL